MYIDKVDSLVDQTLDSFYTQIIRSKEFSNALLEPNFVQYQSKINEVLTKFVSTINIKQIQQATGKNTATTNAIVEMLKRYITYHLFITIGLLYNGKAEMFINNLIEFNKNQPGHSFKTANMFNSDSTGKIIHYTDTLKLVLTVVSADSKKLDLLKQNPTYRPAFKFLSRFSNDFISKSFKLNNLKGNRKVQAHNLIKTLILYYMYYSQEKKGIVDLYSSTDKTEGEFIFIDVVMPVKEYISFDMIERALPKEDVDTGLAYELYDIITNFNNTQSFTELTPDTKIIRLFESGLVVPVVEDLLLYHKDSEQYDKREKQDKKKDIRIKTIVTKIDRATDLNTEAVQKSKTLKENTEKLFYKPMADRAVVIINSNEDTSIVNKMMIHGTRVTDDSAYFKDLMTYRMYPYINYKELSKDGFTLQLEDLNKAVDAVRSVSLTQQAKKTLQMRVGSDEQTIKIIGLIVPTNLNHLHCLRTSDLTDTKSFNTTSKQLTTITNNGYIAVKEFIHNTVFKRRSWSTSMLWNFNNTNDLVVAADSPDTADNKTLYQEGATDTQEVVRLTVAQLHDDILEFMYLNMVSYLEKNKYVEYYNFRERLKMMEDLVLKLPRSSAYYQKLKHAMFYKKTERSVDEYDKQEDEFWGLTGDVTKLPKYTRPKKDKTVKITINLGDTKVKKKTKDVEETDAIVLYNATCQHHYDWDLAKMFRKKNPNKFSKMVFEFVYQYVIIDSEGFNSGESVNYVCKSCGTELDLKNHVKDGAFNSSGNFVTHYTSIEMPLDEVYEYSKFNVAIRSIDKSIDRLSSITHLNMFTGASTDAKNYRKNITKNVIDLVTIHHNKELRKTYNNRKTQLTTLYGISTAVSDLFTFEMNNSIFTYSTKDKDHFKPVKQNNTLTCSLLFMMLNLNATQVLNMIGGKNCNYYLFEKYGLSMFDNIKIITNSKSKTEPVKSYRLLCYLLYYVSCSISMPMYDLWFTVTDTRQLKDTDTVVDKKRSKKINPAVQKIVIVTTIDLINSILEVANSKKKSINYLYKVISSKFFQQLQTTFSDKKADGTSTKVLTRLEEYENSKIVTQDGKKRYMVTTIKSLYLRNYVPYLTPYQGLSEMDRCMPAKSYVGVRINPYEKYYEISNITNCTTGEFHVWRSDSNTLTCQICRVSSNRLTYNKTESEKAQTNHARTLTIAYASKYCSSGKLHRFIMNKKKNCNVCIRCSFEDVGKMSKEELSKLDQNIQKMRSYQTNKAIQKAERLAQRVSDRNKRYNKVINDLKADMSRSKKHRDDHYGFLTSFINHIEAVIGKDININNSNTYLRYDTYIINHDHNGYPVDNNIVVINRENRIKFKRNDPFFKKDVLYYTNYKTGRIDVYYDANTYLLLGYREPNKEYQLSKMHGRHLKVNYSVLNQLKMLGYRSRWLSMKDSIKDMRTQIKHDTSKADVDKMKQEMLRKVVTDESHDRGISLKKTMYNAQRFVNRVKNRYKDPEPKKIYYDNEEYQPKVKPHLTDKYMSKLKKFTLGDKNDFFFKDWKAIYYGLQFKSVHDRSINIDANQHSVIYSDVADHDPHGNLVLFYIVQNFSDLISYNKDRFDKVNTVFFILDIINYAHKSINKEEETTNHDLKRFSYLMKSKRYMFDSEAKARQPGMISGETEGFYGEYRDADDVDDPSKLEALKDAREETESLDTEPGNNDFEDDYDQDFS